MANNSVMAMKVYTLEEIQDKYIGKLGTPQRDKYEQDLSEELEPINQLARMPFFQSLLSFEPKL